MKNIYLYQKLGYQEFKRSAISDSLTRVYLEEDRIKYLKLMIAYFALFKYYPLLEKTALVYDKIRTFLINNDITM
jgi:hypothetical protein